eukprot:gene2160-2813_t
MGPGTVANLVPLDAGRGVYVTGNKISLSETIYLSLGSGIFSGWNRIVLVDGSNFATYNVDVLNGKVQELQSAAVRWHFGSGWASWGVAEYTGDTDISILYSSTNGVIERQNLYGVFSVETVHSSSLGAISSFTVDTKLNRWYYYYSGVSSFGNYSEAVGAGYNVGAFFVTSLASTNSHVVNVTSLAHAFYGGIALSATKVFVAG